jgi:hypothetical protein
MSRRISVLIMVISLFTFWCSNFASAQDTRTTKSGYLASVSEELLDKAIDYVVAKDQAALQKLMDSNLVFMLKGGVKVYIVDTKMFSGKVKIRPAGETVEVWTLIEAVMN